MAENGRKAVAQSAGYIELQENRPFDPVQIPLELILTSVLDHSRVDTPQLMLSTRRHDL